MSLAPNQVPAAPTQRTTAASDAEGDLTRDGSPNPLIGLNTPIAFDRIRAEHVEPAIDQLIADARAELDRIAAGPRTAASTLWAFDHATRRLDEAMSLVSHLENVATEPALRAAYNAVQPKVSAFYSGIPLSKPLWNALREFAETDEARSLDGPQKRFLDKTLADFRRHGAELDDEGKRRLSAIDVELSELTTRFSQNVLDATNAYELLVDDPARLAGLPEGAREAAARSAKERGQSGYRFTLQAPSYLPAMTYLEDRSLREQLYRAYQTRASRGQHDNRPLVRRIVELRRQRAALLGFGNFADLVLEDRMAKNGQEARAFVRRLRERTEPFFARENEELTRFAGNFDLQPWDIAFYAERQRKALYDFDEESLRPWFSAEKILQGAFDVAARLYGVNIEPVDLPVWDPAVRAFRIHEEGRELATFYVDLYPRSNKRDGAWMHGLLTSHGDPRNPAVAVFAANVTPPAPDRPALLTHREMETLFHEFGHLMHHALSTVEVRSLAGTSVAWDFVELPSQIMENWCWEREALDLFARHFRTDEPIPAAELAKMTRARTFRAANATMRQLGFAELDLALHMDFDPGGQLDPVEMSRRILEQYSPVPLPADHAMVAGFTHLFASPVGYAAGYYSYKWAEVLDADAFTRFSREGIFSREVGAAFRTHILARGDAEDPAELYRRFMGRDPDVEALMRRAGLVAASPE